MSHSSKRILTGKFSTTTKMNKNVPLVSYLCCPDPKKIKWYKKQNKLDKQFLNAQIK